MSGDCRDAFPLPGENDKELARLSSLNFPTKTRALRCAFSVQIQHRQLNGARNLITSFLLCALFLLLSLVAILSTASQG